MSAIGKGALDASDAECNNLALGLDALGGAVTSDGVRNSCNRKLFPRFKYIRK